MALRRRGKLLGLIMVLSLFLIAPATASASHSWNGYHWARSTSSFDLKMGNSLSGAWQTSYGIALSDWSQSSVLNTVSADAGRRSCRPTRGRVEVCNNTYGQNGWLGQATIWIRGTHIYQGQIKLNDTYYNTSRYNTADERQWVMCQEMGHTLGLDHNDDNFATTTGTCMDYSSQPGAAAANAHPNAHDYAQLVSIYTHLDSGTTVSSRGHAWGKLKDEHAVAAASGPHRHRVPPGWGKSVKKSSDGMREIYVKELPGGEQVVRFINWAEN